MSVEVTQGVASFCAPTFVSHNPTVWFTILECNFKIHCITSSLKKFCHATSLLPFDVLSQVSNAIFNASTSDSPYEDLKTAILSHHEASLTILFQMLSKEELGNEKPSDLLRRMKRLLGDKYESFDKERFSRLFYQRLPLDIQQSLFSVKGKIPLDDLAKLADDFMASIPAAPQPTASDISDKIQQLTAFISQLALKVNALEEQLHNHKCQRSLSPWHHHHRSRSRSSPRHSPVVCYYHKKFGQDARHCTKPCTFQDLA